MALGDGFLRNVYALFDYGDFVDPTLDETKDAFAQLLPLENPHDALQDFLESRQNALSTLAPEATPDQVRQLLQQAIMSSSASESDSVAETLDDTVSSSNSSALLERINIFGPVIIGLLSGTLLIGILLFGIALSMCVRKGASMESRSRSVPSYAPVRFKEEGPRAEDQPYPTQYSD